MENDTREPCRFGLGVNCGLRWHSPGGHNFYIIKGFLQYLSYV
ncbi:hypothetical protein DOT_5590 [Desulfosporosinus sp. OT]|nr:hypothetical protein DOT_5590 [Desulfosporosinus sp. OT]